MNEILLSAREAQCLAEPGYIRLQVNGEWWRLVHESYSRPFPQPADRHVSLSAAEVDIITRMPEGLIVGGITIRSGVAV